MPDETPNRDRDPGHSVEQAITGEVIAAEAAAPQDALTADEVKARALGGTATLGFRSVLVIAGAVVGNLVLARLLAPRDFGLVALGTTLIALISYISYSGVSPALIGRREPPARDELEASLGLLLAVTTAIAVLFAAVALPLGEEGAVTALMLIAMPLYSLRLPTALVLERQLSYGTIARAEVVEFSVGYAWAIATVAAGAGVWGLASSIPVRSLVGSVVLIRGGPMGWVGPRWRWALVRPLMAFGLRFQAINAVTSFREQILNLGIWVIGSISTLGIWSLAFRLMQLPFMFLVNLWRVSYPAMSRLLETDENPRAVIERGAGVAAVALSPLLVGIAAGTPDLLPWLIGEQWAAVPSILVWACLGMMISAPVSIPTIGYLLASEDTSSVLYAVSAGAVAWITVSLALLTPVGVASIGLGWVAMGVVEALLLGRSTARRTGAQLARSIGPPLGVAVIAVSAGLALGTLVGGEPAAGFVSLIIAELMLMVGLRGFAWDELRATVRLGRQAVASARAS